MWGLTWKLGLVGAGVWGVAGAARNVAVAVYGDLPSYASQCLVVLASGLIFSYAGVAYNYLFTAIGAQRDGMAISVVNAMITVALVVPLTSRWGAIGAAAGVVIGQGAAGGLALAWLDTKYLRAWAQGAPPATP